MVRKSIPVVLKYHNIQGGVALCRSPFMLYKRIFYTVRCVFDKGKRKSQAIA